MSGPSIERAGLAWIAGKGPPGPAGEPATRAREDETPDETRARLAAWQRSEAHARLTARLESLWRADVRGGE